MIRKRTFTVFRESLHSRDYDERPMLPDDIDIQVHLSRNRLQQPFFLMYDKDTLLAQISGTGRIEFKGVNVAWFRCGPGDYIYLPAGVPHRYRPEAESVQLRYRPMNVGHEGVAWFCVGCDTELHREEWDCGESNSQEMYFSSCTRFNDEDSLRRCHGCGATHPPIDTAPYQWSELAREMRTESMER